MLNQVNLQERQFVINSTMLIFCRYAEISSMGESIKSTAEMEKP